MVLYLVCRVLRTWVLHLHQHIGMQEVGGDNVRNERCGLLLEDGSHDVVSYVPFPLELKETAKCLCQIRHFTLTAKAVMTSVKVWYLLDISLSEGKLG